MQKKLIRKSSDIPYIDYSSISHCPFCGGKGHIVRKHKCVFKGEEVFTTYIYCTECSSTSPKFNLADYNTELDANYAAIDAWNRRDG